MSNAKPELPKRFMFSGKGILARAVGDKVSFGQGKAKADGSANQQIAISFRIEPGQRANIYAAPDDPTGRLPKPGSYAEIPAGFTVTYLKSMTPGTMEYIVQGLRNAGWKGSKLTDLMKGKADGLGDVECKLEISIKELFEVGDKAGQYLVNDKGEFNPQMNVEWINKAGGFNFKEEANPNAIADLDAQFASMLAAPGGTATPAKRALPRPAAATAAPGDETPDPNGDIPF